MKFFGRKVSGSEHESAAAPAKESPAVAPVVRNVIIFDGSMVHDWPALFATLGPLPDGSTVRVLQTSWMDAEVTTHGDASGCQLSMKPVKDSFGEAVDRKTVITVRPHYILQRNQARGPSPGSDRRHVLYGLLMANVPAMNSLMSEYQQLERAVMLGALREINERLGQEAFPLNEVTYFSNASSMVISPDLPAVLKISHAHAGQGISAPVFLWLSLDPSSCPSIIPCLSIPLPFHLSIYQSIHLSIHLSCPSMYLLSIDCCFFLFIFSL
jgi:hypothetical protein